jgi:5'-nucleotidase
VKLLVVNDDGIDAEGIQTLFQAARSAGSPVMVAPASGQSGMSHAVTLEKGVRIDPRGEAQYAVHGTPADCTRLALSSLAPETRWVLSGINHGGNLGADVHYSGTVAAVREGALHGIPGIAFSQYRRRNLPLDWARALRWIQPLLGALLLKPVEPGVFYNVNLPHLDPTQPDPEVVECNLDSSPLPLQFRSEESLHFYSGEYQGRARKPGTDVDLCFSGKITVSKLRLF